MTEEKKIKPLVRLEWDKAAQLLEAAQSVVVVTHVQPDGDAIGSMMGLALALRERGKSVTPVVDDGVPRHFRFVPSSEDIHAEVDGLKPDLMISTDASDRERLGEVGQQLLEQNLPLIQLDHHQTNIMFGDAQLVDARWTSAAEGVLAWLDQLGWEISPAVARALLTGIVTDTGGFRHSNVTANTLDCAQRLMNAGADLAEIVQRALVRTPVAQLRLYGEVLPRLQLDGGVIWVDVRPEDYEKAGMGPQEYTGLSSYLVQAEEAVISATFSLVDENVVECSFRSDPGFNVADIAFELGGGGHVQASGCTLRETSLEDALARVVPMLKAEAARGVPLYT
jgi:phosphoesterase RecJ-like protein